MCTLNCSGNRQSLIVWSRPKLDHVTCTESGTYSGSRVKTAHKRKYHSLHNSNFGYTIVNHVGFSRKKQRTLDTFVQRKPRVFNGLDVDETINCEETSNSDVVILEESLSSIRNNVGFENDSDVEILSEACCSDIDEFQSRSIPCNKRKIYKTDNVKKPVEFGNDLGVEVTGDTLNTSKVSSYCNNFKKPEHIECGKEFTAGIAHKIDDTVLESSSVLDDGMNSGKEVDLPVKMTGVGGYLQYAEFNRVTKNLVCDVIRKKLKILTNRCTKKVLKERSGKTKENCISAANGVTKLPVKWLDCDFPLRENCQNFVEKNCNLKLELVFNKDNKTDFSGTPDKQISKYSEDCAREENIFSENSNTKDCSEIKSCEYNGEIEDKVNNCKHLSILNGHKHALYSAMQHLIENNHDCAYRRLNVMFPMSCALQPYICYKLHKHRKKPENSSLPGCMCELHFLEGQWDDAIEVLEPLVSKTVCPDWKIIAYLLAYMCETDDVENLNAGCEIFNSLVFCHPPCYRSNYYLKIFTQAVEMQSLKNGGISNDGIFRDVLLNLQHYGRKTKFSEAYVYEFEGFASINNIESQCLVMELMVDVLTADLVVWLPRRSYNPIIALSKIGNCPLIVRLLWSGNKDGLEQFNDMKVVNLIIDLYVSSFNKEAPPKLTCIISQLLALIAEVMHALDFEKNATYPHFGQHSRNLAHAIYISIANQPASTIQKMIQGLSPSWLEMLVCYICVSHFTTNSVMLQTLEFVTNCKKAVEHKSKLHGSVRINSKGETRLHIVCRNDKLDELKHLLSSPSVNVNVADNAGWTPLHEAVLKGNVKIVETLIRYRPPGSKGGLDLRAAGLKGKTPLMEAVEEGHISLCKLLLKYGGASLLEDKQDNGNTAWDLAESADVKELLNQCVHDSGSCVGALSDSSCAVVFKCAPKQEFWHLLSSFSFAYMDTFILKDLLCYAASGCNSLPENRDGKVQLTFDANRLDADVVVLEEVQQFLMSCKSSAPL